jgi:hypothetical protein
MSLNSEFQPVVIQGGASARSKRSPSGRPHIVWRNPFSDPDVELTPDQELICLRLLGRALSQKKREPSKFVAHRHYRVVALAGHRERLIARRWSLRGGWAEKRIGERRIIHQLFQRGKTYAAVSFLVLVPD